MRPEDGFTAIHKSALTNRRGAAPQQRVRDCEIHYIVSFGSYTDDLLDVRRGRNYKTRLWRHYVRSEPNEFERLPVHAWNRYLLQFYRPFCQRDDLLCLLRQEIIYGRGKHLEEALEKHIYGLFNDIDDDIQEAPTSMMDHW